MPTAARPAFACATLATLALLAASPVLAASPTGTWLIEDGTARVRIAPCGTELCGNVAWIKESEPRLDVNNPDPAKRGRSLIGSAVLLGLKPSGPDVWTGSLYNAQDGRTYSGKLTVEDERHVKVAGCVLGGLICKSQTWTRVR
jgi:uncharacterized protein (DUF2147 family)